MDTRQAVGIAVIAAVIAAGAAIPGLRAVPVPGIAQAAAVSPEPVVGDCLTQALPGDTIVFGEQIRIQPATLQPCTGPRFGEVVSVTPGALWSAPGDVADAPDRCIQDGWRYLGVPDPDPTIGQSFGPSLVASSILLGPDQRQASAGQAWTACVLFAPSPATGETMQQVPGSLRDAWKRRGDSAPYATCLNPGTDGRPAALCSSPHQLEQVGVLFNPSTNKPEQWVQACADGASQAMGGSWSIDDGTLTVLAEPWDVPNRQSSDPAIEVRPVSVDCLIQPTDPQQRLIGSVRNLGGAPLALSRK